MALRIQVFLLTIYFQVFVIAAVTNPDDFDALGRLKDNWQNTPPNWKGLDPCGDGWEGIQCKDFRITALILSGIGLKGSLTADIEHLPELQTLDLSQNKDLGGILPTSIVNLKKLQYLSLAGCSFRGWIPDPIGSLVELQYLFLTSNNFDGEIPSSIGNLSKLQVLDLTDNKLSGPIPVSDGDQPGLDMLQNLKHIHLGQNQLNGTLSQELFSSKMTLKHVILNGNQLSGDVPPTLGYVKTLEIIRLDRNLLNGKVNLDFTNLTSLTELHLFNNKLTRPLPDLSSVSSLKYVDMSNNSFSGSSIPPWFSTLTNLTSLKMERTQLQGTIPTSIFNLPRLESVVLSNNQLIGTLDIGNNYSKALQLIDVQNNSIGNFSQETSYNNTLMLGGNACCNDTRSSRNYCGIGQQPNSSYSPGQENCSNCTRTFPVAATLAFIVHNFSDLKNASYYSSLGKSLLISLLSEDLPVNSVIVTAATMDSTNDYLQVTVKVCPSHGSRFNRTDFSAIVSLLGNFTFFNVPPFNFFLNEPYTAPKNATIKRVVIIGVSIGGSILLLLAISLGVYAVQQKRRAERAIQLYNPFASWNEDNGSGLRPQLNQVMPFSFEELKKFTNNFSDDNIIGTGGYGKVYRGTLNGMVVAIKRAQQGSQQGSNEFKMEIELLSRVHHRNVVNLVGFCYEQGEQILVYEYAPNGTLKDSLSGKSGIRLNWTRRLRLAVDAARSLAYLHEFANPPIVHRDIKSSNILLDQQLNAKVADFGISKPVSDEERDCVASQLKGTRGYMDPESRSTGQLTQKSDVYSFGVVMLELITAQKPVENGVLLVYKVKNAVDKTKTLYNLDKMLDPTIVPGSTLENEGLLKFVDLAMWCVEKLGANRPPISQVVKQIENILQLAGFDSNVDIPISSGIYDSDHTDDNILTATGTTQTSNERSDITFPYSYKTALDHSRFQGG